MAVPRKPKPRTPAEDSQIKSAMSRRKDFESANPERFKGVESQPGFTTHSDTYRDLGIGIAQEPGSTSFGQQALPGMEKRPGIVDSPARWEDLHPNARASITRKAAKFGVTHSSAVRALGAQVDQGLMAEGQHRSFYGAEGFQPSGEMTPRTRLKTSAKENNVPFEQQAAANAITSPQQRFSAVPKSGPHEGQRVYPNDRNASAAIQAAKEGKPESALPAYGFGGINSNSRKAAHVVAQMQAGKSAAEAWHAGPKTGPYHNSWVDPHGPQQFFVSDVHSGGGGIAPHLSNVSVDGGDTERGKYLGIQGIHSFNDHVARKVMQQRGLQSLSGMQSAQWNQERDTVNQEKGGRAGGSRADVLGTSVAPQPAAIHGQMDLFSGNVHHAPVAAPSSATTEKFQPSLKDHMAAQAISAAHGKKRARQNFSKISDATPVGSAYKDDAWLSPPTNQRF